ncbi:thioredoxin domain-containing protein [Virgibacillus alimentarius]|uniref:Uncharacterized protein YyaL (SSP411 family) n=1 Tax=Virgibacillus alimentarius TaxID=698769 RepID=A0ABS4SDA9_9BACI|nr:MULTISPECIES: thioredoxin domain-containing protein [Virgibacillus]MBP2258382.1 uncharacterized protein YyaL (SSP411 family) [Virgibacillus alimentarius]HLR67639.1 thioredoxin domain-containing protein [Virgibacillus sp.]
MPANQNAPNRLINEKSPYLLQHAYNPVDWYAWSTEAFQKAKQENKPIFLSIGYSTCHWCHVMAHESFEDEDVAAILNENFISIKVDREERPDIDAVYMKVCQMMTGHGGWPLTIFMTPDKIPFYAGTYFPKESKYGLPGIKEALTQLYARFVNDPDHIDEVTDSVTAALKQTVQSKSGERLTKEAVDETYEQLKKSFDDTNGGFGSAPKFPQPQNILFLLRYYHFTGKSGALQMAEVTLQSMAAGGIYDHVGFGFARYATDQEWLVPHFEKMLYDNALLLMAYTECYQITKKPIYEKISKEIIAFVLREMKSSEDAFYSAIDADSEGVEGKYYVWGYEEIFRVLGEELGELYTKVYDITPDGNFEGKNIPNLLRNNLRKIAQKNKLTEEKLRQKLKDAQEKLLEAREERVYPHVDDKILTSWNGLMIAAFAKAGRVFKDNHSIKAAKEAMQFIEENLYHGKRLMARYRDGETKYNAYIDDYAFLLWAYVELYNTSFSIDYLRKGKELADQMIGLFWDETDGGFYFSGDDSEVLISREKEIYDGALPSGNSVAAVMLMRLGYLTGELKYLDKVEEMYYTFFKDLDGYGLASAYFMQSLLLTENPTKEVVVLGAADAPERKQLLEMLHEKFLPNVTAIVSDQADHFSGIAPFAAAYKQIDQKTTIYVCENFSCHQPTSDIEHAKHMILEG